MTKLSPEELATYSGYRKSYILASEALPLSNAQLQRALDTGASTRTVTEAIEKVNRHQSAVDAFRDYKEFIEGKYPNTDMSLVQKADG